MIHFPPLCASDGIFLQANQVGSSTAMELEGAKGCFDRKLLGLQLEYLFLNDTEELQSGSERINLLWTTTSISGMYQRD